MIVYVALGEDHDGSSVYGVYSTPERAVAALQEAVAREQQNDKSQFTSYTWYKYYPVEIDGVAQPSWLDLEDNREVLVLDMTEYNNAMLYEGLDKKGQLEYNDGWEQLSL